MVTDRCNRNKNRGIIKKMTTQFTLGDIITSAKGAKSIQISTTENQAFIWMPSESLTTCYEPSAYNDENANRVNVCFAVTETLEKQLKSYDDVIIKALVKDSTKYFGTVQTETQIKDRFQPSIKVSEKGFSNFRAKMNKSGKTRVQTYNMDKEPRQLPDSWANVAVHARLHLKGLWMMGKDLGPLWELVAVQIDERAQVCPF
jgi:hypothetical protein